MSITTSHVINFLEMSTGIKLLHDAAEASLERHAHVVADGNHNQTSKGHPRHHPSDGATTSRTIR